MLRVSLKAIAGLLIVLLPLGAGGCADSIERKGPVGRFAELMKSYDKTLTKDQQRAAIAELQSDAKHQGSEAKQATSSVGAQTEPGN
jgi:hypothetical protein